MFKINASPSNVIDSAIKRASAGAQSSSTPSVQSLKQAIAKISNAQAGKSLLFRGDNINRISASDWRAKYPYSLMILEVTGSAGNPRYILSPNLKFTLPITPQQLSISSHFASHLSFASRGVLEEHSGMNVKSITISGTTGVYIKRPSYTAESKPTGVLSTIFAGTLQSINNLQNAVKSVTGFASPKNNTINPNDQDSLDVFSGYYQYHLLKSFLEAYAQLKKSPEGKKYRLGLELGKDKVIYLITPQSFNTQKDASAPLEIQWSLQALAWATVDDTSLLSAADESLKFLGEDIGKTQKVLNGIRNLRNVLFAAQSLIRSAGADVQVNIIGPIQSIILAISDVLAIPRTVADVFTSLDSSIKKDIIGAIQTLSNTSADLTKLKNSNPNLSFQFLSSSLESVGDTPFTSFNFNIDDSSLIDLFSSFSLDGLPLSNETNLLIENAINTSVNSVDENTVDNTISALQSLSNSLANLAALQGPDSDAWMVMDNINNSLGFFYYLKATGFFKPSSTTDQQTGVNRIVEFYQNQVESGGGDTVTPRSKFAIPFPLGVSLEWLAQRYLGSAERWHEIVAVNNLKPPYIDEEGFVRPFLTNGSGNQFVIESAENLVVGQYVWIYSDAVKINKRKIKAIQKITNTQYIIVVDGKDDLSQYLVTQKASMKAYLPYTVNSQKLIYIPTTDLATQDAINLKSLPFVEENPELINFSRVDLLLNSNGDLVINPDGNINLSYGKNNIIQAARLKMETALGSLLNHPDYGAGVQSGASVSDISVDEIIQRIKSSFESDPRFQGVTSIELDATQNGALSIKLNALASNNFGNVPLEFQL